MKARTAARFILLGGAALAAFVAVEAVVRVMCVRDEDGGVKFRDTRLKPYRVPAAKAERVLREYLASEKSSLIFDADLGWRQRPSHVPHNRHGFITSAPEPSPEPVPGVLRIAVFGGSYTQGTFEHGWWRVLERELNAAGVKAEVLNFGVAGFGMDQAYLRWKRDGRQWKPHLAVFGWAAGNCYDNVNMVRMVKDPDTGIPFTKPRFVLDDGGELRLVNAPTPAPEAVPGIMRDLAHWQWISHEHFYEPSDFRMTWWRWSRVGALAEAKLGSRARMESPERFYAMADEPARLALAITRRFRAEVEGSGSQFVAAHLPYHTELDALAKSGRWPHADLWAAVQAATPTIEPEKEMLAACGGRSAIHFFQDGHYDDSMQAVVGKKIAREIAARWAPAENPGK